MARYENNHSRSDAWKRIDEQRRVRKFFHTPREYTGYYGDANQFEEQGQNRFGSNHVPEYNDNRFLDTDDNFIDDFAMTTGLYRDSAQMGKHFGKGPKGYKRSDERIREDVCDALYKSYAVDATDIEVEVKDAEVILKGRVNDRNSKREAERCAESIPGVFDVRNELRIASR